MKLRRFASFALGLCILSLGNTTVWARLPRPHQHQGIVVSVGGDTRTIILAESRKPKFRLGKIVKPTTFVWNEKTQFVKSGRQAEVTAVAQESQVRLEYYYPPKKGRPVLVQVTWDGGEK